MHNHSSEGVHTIHDNHYTRDYMNFRNPAFNASAGPNSYTVRYDDTTGTMVRWINNVKIYTAAWKWNESLGGTGHGPDATTILNMAVGGSWPGYTSNPSSFSADYGIYSVEYSGP